MLPPELLELIKAGGAALAPVGFFLWWLERDERKETQKENTAMAKEFIPALVELKHVITTVKQMTGKL